MITASRNLLQQFAQAIALFIVPLTITGSVVEGVANKEGVQMTALIAAVTIAIALVFYLFYNDKKITKTIDDYNAQHEEDGRS